jgi:hypothetical protein
MYNLMILIIESSLITMKKKSKLKILKSIMIKIIISIYFRPKMVKVHLKTKITFLTVYIKKKCKKKIKIVANRLDIPNLANMLIF